MNDRKLVELLVDYGRIAYGMAYIKLASKGLIPTYELLKEELESMLVDEKQIHVKTR